MVETVSQEWPESPALGKRVVSCGLLGYWEVELTAVPARQGMS